MKLLNSVLLLSALLAMSPDLSANAARGGRMGGGSFRSSRTSYRSTPTASTRTTTTTTYRTAPPAPTRTVYVPVQTPPPRSRLGDAVRTGAAVAGGVVAGNLISDAIRRPVVQAAPSSMMNVNPTPATLPVPATATPTTPLATVQTVDNWWGGFGWGGGVALLLSWLLFRRR